MSNMENEKLEELLMDSFDWNVHLQKHRDYAAFPSCRFCKIVLQNNRAEYLEMVHMDPNAYDADAGDERTEAYE